MEKGHFRCDANISLRPRGQRELGTRTELKNLNSFRFVEGALAAETERQTEILEQGGEVQQATMAFDPVTRSTRVLRVKENADDYRYFPDPDLIPLVFSQEQVERVRSELPELADEKCERFQTQYELSEYDARSLAASRRLADFFEAAAADYGRPKPVANWMLRDLLQALAEQDLEIEAAEITPEALSALIRLVDEGRTTAKSARGLVPELVRRGGDPAALVRERGLEAVSDAGVLERAVDGVLKAHAGDVERYRAGEEKVLNFLMGQVMRRTQGKANPGAVREILARALRAEAQGRKPQ
jgi:aspartyl-tRNA(Asn)/glutamyl-tRNA(Gln) amidotransferase subunit B